LNAKRSVFQRKVRTDRTQDKALCSCVTSSETFERTVPKRHKHTQRFERIVGILLGLLLEAHQFFFKLLTLGKEFLV